ncbi:UNVERIFIED_CONTAM: hypothetical protein ABIC26_000487 [Paenibacillus sp. PvR008]
MPDEWSLHKKNILPSVSFESDSRSKMTLNHSEEENLLPDSALYRSREQGKLRRTA